MIPFAHNVDRSGTVGLESLYEKGLLVGDSLL